MKLELQRAALFIGLMFVAVGLIGMLASIRHGLNTLALMVGVLGAVLALWAYHSRAT